MPRLRAVLLAFVVLALAAGPALGQRVLPRPPASEGLVIDRAGLLAPAERQALNQKLVAFDDTTSNQIVVVILPDLGGMAAQQYATELGQAWGVGQGGKDNGVVFLISTEDRQVFIATGYGLEGAIPDAVAGRIIRRIVVPSFRQGQFYGGISEAVSALMAAAEGEYDAEPREAPGDGVPMALLVILADILISLFSSGKKGGGGRRVRRRRGMPPVVIFPGVFGGGGGGGGFGGGFGGGGFGGFGGGGFGGGGAGGGW